MTTPAEESEVFNDPESPLSPPEDGRPLETDEDDPLDPPDAPASGLAEDTFGGFSPFA